MTVRLTPMCLEQYLSWRNAVVEDYAAAAARAWQISPNAASAMAEQAFHELFPEGFNTANTHLYAVVDADNGCVVGDLVVQVRNHPLEVFICDIRVVEVFRRQGYGKQILQALETSARNMGVCQISLHVFGDNERARELYHKAGFTVASLFMTKRLQEAAHGQIAMRQPSCPDM
ncbi:MAG: GNAT family N-acetyltransferase [Alicyclobacillus sp.]|nr:GNAT family N-acetyltransferase [Alicyclobacillus sp.]